MADITVKIVLITGRKLTYVMSPNTTFGTLVNSIKDDLSGQVFGPKDFIISKSGESRIYINSNLNDELRSVLPDYNTRSKEYTYKLIIVPRTPSSSIQRQTNRHSNAMSELTAQYNRKNGGKTLKRKSNKRKSLKSRK